MKYYTLLFIIVIQLSSIKVAAQSDEISLSVIGINNLNEFTKGSDKNGPLKTFWSPTMLVSAAYTTKIFHSNFLFHTSISAIGLTNSVSLVFENGNCEGCTSKRKSLTGSIHLGLQLGIGKRFFLGRKQSLDIVGGILVRKIFKGFTGSRGLVCSEVICTRMIFNQGYVLDGTIHPSLYAKISWPFYKTKDKKFDARLVLTYAHGLSSIYAFSSYVKFVQENIEYNYRLENRGTLFGIGVSINVLRTKSN